MKKYLENLITEHTNRALVLKKLIPYPITFETLVGVAERCRMILDEQIVILNALKVEISFRDENDVRDIYVQLRICGRDITKVEYYGIPALYYPTKQAGLLNNILKKIHNEIKLPFPHPAVCCISNKYYFSVPDTNTIFVPLGESDFLLQLPDLYHELGHYALVNSVTELRLKPLMNCYEKSQLRIENYYNKLIKSKKRESGPKEIVFSIERIKEQWREYWFDEFFCDLFAVYALGPAYVWSHMHLTTISSSDINMLSILLAQTHPSDESRMRILLKGLNLIGFSEEKNKILEEWNKVSKNWPKPSSIYQYAYPNDLLDDLSKLIFDAIKQTGLLMASQENICTDKESNEMKILFNEAWDRYWRKSPEEFRKWEENKISELKQQLEQTTIQNK